jgi:hypothetical protein
LILSLLLPQHDLILGIMDFSDDFLCFVDRASRYKHTCNETNFMRYSSSVYFVTIPLHVSGFLVVYHQEVAVCLKSKCTDFLTDELVM